MALVGDNQVSRMIYRRFSHAQISHYAHASYSSFAADNNTAGHLTLDKLPDGKSFATKVAEYLTKRTEKPWVDDEANSAIVVKSHEQKGNTIFGTLKAGEFGLTAELENMKTGEKDEDERPSPIPPVVLLCRVQAWTK